MPKAEQLSGAMVETMQKAIAGSLQNWVDNHPIIAWAIAHPIYTTSIFLLVLFLFWGLLRVIGRLTEQVWIAILQSPFKIGQWSLAIITKNFKYVPEKLASVTNIKANPKHEERLSYILSRLEALRQEENELLREIQAIIYTGKKGT